MNNRERKCAIYLLGIGYYCIGIHIQPPIMFMYCRSAASKVLVSHSLVLHGGGGGEALITRVLYLWWIIYITHIEAYTNSMCSCRAMHNMQRESKSANWRIRHSLAPEYDRLKTYTKRIYFILKLNPRSRSRWFVRWKKLSRSRHYTSLLE